jgi:hypothetical protein
MLAVVGKKKRTEVRFFCRIDFYCYLTILYV